MLNFRLGGQGEVRIKERGGRCPREGGGLNSLILKVLSASGLKSTMSLSLIIERKEYATGPRALPSPIRKGG